MNLKIKQLNPEQPAGVSLPAYPGDAGLDLIALNDVIIPPNSYINIPHGFAIEIPEGYFGYVMPCPLASPNAAIRPEPKAIQYPSPVTVASIA